MSEKPPDVWTIDQIILQQWLALPKKDRKPKTMGLLAESLGVDPMTLTRWKKLDGFMDEVRQVIRSELQDDLSEIYSALRREAKTGSYQHIKLALELTGDYVERSQQDINANVQGRATVTHVIDSTTAGNIFDILKAAGVFAPETSDTAA
jgi:hypothetical protein